MEAGMSDINVFDEAKEIISGPRRESFGPAKQSFQRIAEMWSVILHRPVTASQVAQCMIGLKLVREANSHHRDNVVDIIGYAGLIEEIGQ
jgi:hypothetical protein